MALSATIAARRQEVLQRIARAAERAGRDPAQVSLLAVTKTHPVETVRQAARAGLTLFGENRVAEGAAKIEAIASEWPNLEWRLIGPLQTNKAKYVARSAHFFHALDRRDVAEELSRRRTGGALACFLEVNVAGEASKSGVPPVGAAKLLDEVGALPHLEVVGLMCLPPLDQDSRPHFDRVAKLAAELSLKQLSFGSTADFEAAIERGATYVRVGTAIFGERPP
jgi:pyridoxal phosphate enzyme (YggS family)